MQCGEVAYHAYEGIVNRKEEQERFVKDLGNKQVLLCYRHFISLRKKRALSGDDACKPRILDVR